MTTRGQILFSQLERLPNLKTIMFKLWNETKRRILDVSEWKQTGEPFFLKYMCREEGSTPDLSTNDLLAPAEKPTIRSMEDEAAYERLMKVVKRRNDTRKVRGS